MYSKDIVKARIKKLECDMLGLVYRLKQLNTQPGCYSSASQAFNTNSARPMLHKSFQIAGRVEQELKLQISLIRNELSALQPICMDAPEFRMAA